MYVLTYFVPSEHAERVKAAVFATGGGAMGNYDRCCFEVEGRGQYRPLGDSRPFIGERGRTEKVRETRVELVVGDGRIHAVVEALLAAHPYEEPAYYVQRALSPEELGFAP
jgi:hypothetical protein